MACQNLLRRKMFLFHKWAIYQRKKTDMQFPRGYGSHEAKKQNLLQQAKLILGHDKFNTTWKFSIGISYHFF